MNHSREYYQKQEQKRINKLYNNESISIENFKIDEPFFDEEFEAKQCIITGNRTMMKEVFNKTKNQIDGIKSKYNSIDLQNQKEMLYHKMIQSNGKICFTCKEIKSINNFHKTKTNKDGYNKHCKDCARIRVRENKANNRERTSKQQIDYIKRRKEMDPTFTLILLERSRLSIACKQFNLSKECSTMEYLGCDGETLAIHLQETAIVNGYTNFDIYNYNTNDYHIDHIIPVKAILDGNATMEEVFHYTNLQILDVFTNLSKSDKY